MKTSIRLLDLIKDSSVMSTIWKQELDSTTDWGTLHNLFYSYRSVVQEMFDIDCEVEYSEVYRKVLDKFERSW
ncbi:hypothetical protein NVP1161O_217 [Vibrio phage 1.161.O._10N.261.48.C5]|nr:hypothetical protein NVP1161O_217 [Vibrio phage 1.161.O._10N.261.48.C5]